MSPKGFKGGKCKSVTCTNSATKNKDMAFHKFPSNYEVCAAWIRACQQPENFSAKHSAMCEDHFVPSDYAGKCHFIPLFVFSNIEKSGLFSKSPKPFNSQWVRLLK